ncbi:hypothetical protein [Roseivirga pacifica]|uniref:hypothetical protein n=1 Tax=Roseivirga pacifica TaxID=1267423 RepID=UPI00227C5836|nr:hypothetical protein [Roseivirga pacifica]
MSNQEQKDKRFSMTMSIIVHGSLLLIFFFLVAWKEPDPPIPEYGIEINFGQQELGGGNTEREAEAKIEDTVEEEAPDSEVETEEVEEIVEETPEEVIEEVTEPVEEVTPPVEETEPEPVKTEEVIEKPVTTPEKAEVKVEEQPKKEEVKPVEEKKEEAKPVEEKKVEEKPVEKPKTVDQRAIMGGKKTNNNTTNPASNNQGDDPDKKGNAGDPEGKKETKGKSPGGADLGGVSLSLDGWKWTTPPGKKDDSQVEGVITFAIRVDDRGDVKDAYKVPETTISDNNIIEFYKKQVMELRFEQIDPSKSMAEFSEGKIVFVIKTN